MSNYTLHKIDAEYWQNFTPMAWNELSDFYSWALRKAFEVMSLDRSPCWMWSDGTLQAECCNNDGAWTKYILAITPNGILFLSEYDADHNQVACHRVELS